MVTTSAVRKKCNKEYQKVRVVSEEKTIPETSRTTQYSNIYKPSHQILPHLITSTCICTIQQSPDPQEDMPSLHSLDSILPSGLDFKVSSASYLSCPHPWRNHEKVREIDARAGPPLVTSTQRLPNSSVAPVAVRSPFPLCLSPLCTSYVYLLFPSIGFAGGTISEIFKGVTS